MHKFSLSVAAAAMITFAQPGLAQQSTTSARDAERTDVKSGTMHDHVERAEKIVKELLAQRSAGATDRAATPKEFVNIERPQLEKLQGELSAMSSASSGPSSSATGTVQSHVAAAQNIVGALETRTTANADVVSVDRKMVKQLRDAIEAIERDSKNK